MNGKDTALFSKASDEWSTPQWLFDLLNGEFKFRLDAAANGQNFKCEGYCDKLGDGLTIDWFYHACGGSIYLNPPYSKIAAFIKKAYEESQKGATVVCLIPSRTDTRYWHTYVMKAAEIRFVKGRLKFGDSKNSAPFPSAVIIFNEAWKSIAGLNQRFPDLNSTPVIGKTIEQPKKEVKAP